MLLLLELGLGGSADLDDRDATGELGQPLLQLLLVPIGRGLLDLRLDLLDAALDRLAAQAGGRAIAVKRSPSSGQGPEVTPRNNLPYDPAICSGSEDARTAMPEPKAELETDEADSIDISDAEDPTEQEEDRGTSEAVSVGDDPPVVTPVTETVLTMLTSIQDGSVVVQPPYQRRVFWDRRKKAALIESLFLGLPLPLFYLADARMTVDGETVRSREVVDGQQRLASLTDFYRGTLTIPDDSVVEEIRGKSYSALRPSLKQAFKDFKLSSATLPIAPRADKFELFRRLNQQSTVLSDQELRNAVHHGRYLTFLKANADRLKPKLRVTETEWSRMKDVEYLTRLLAFERAGYQGFPNKRLNKFLNDEMKAGELESDSDHRRRLARVEKALQRAEWVFGDLRFRPYRIKDTGFDGEWARQLNRALMEVQVWTLIDHARYGFTDSSSFDSAVKSEKNEIVEMARRLH